MTQPKISIIYVNYFSEKYLTISIESLLNNILNIDYEIIVVDNSVNIESKDKLEKLKEKYSNISLFFNNENYGFGKGCNIGVKYARGEYIVFVNPDIIFKNNSILDLMNIIEKDLSIGAVGCLTYEGERGYKPGGARKFHTFFTEFLERSNIVNFLYKNPYYFRWNFDSIKAVDALMGAIFITRKDVFEKLGGFDENFFLYYEEIDFFKRLWNNGYKVFFINTSYVIHIGGVSTKNNFSNERILLENLKSAKYYFLKHHGKIYTFLWCKMIILVYFIKYIASKKKIYLNLAKWGLKN